MKNVLALTLLLLSPAAFGYFEQASGVIGILKLPEIFGGSPCDGFKPRDTPIFQSPDSVQPFGKIFIVKPKQWLHPSDVEGACEHVASVQGSTTDPTADRGALPTLEYAYSENGAIVINQNGPWFEIALHKGSAWVKVQNMADFLPVEKLLKEHLTYLRVDLPILIYNNPDQTTKFKAVKAKNTFSNISAEVLAFSRVEGKLWVKVKTHQVDPCDGNKNSIAPILGWLPFHNPQGQPTVWFASRGC